ncbi:dihydrolipoyl dehydrogenase family protein [Shouchella shacheensis]|uniref:dihydrolipoyl dehydrogenase family protein n=1 Tax=Shouchella shacheensis TaxID=1649580 RepID=UPI000740572A|nr:FAD-dependent oxidoreductase [Shouchella shacheensis]
MVVGEIAQERQLIVIGGGPGGYHTAIRAAQLGLDVLLVERNQLGGVCLNQGCIPSKVHTYAAEQWKQAKQNEHIGIPAPTGNFDWQALHTHQAKVVHQLRQGVHQLCKAQKIEVVEGEATFLSEDRIGVENGHNFDVYQFQHAVIATGQRPSSKAAVNAHTLFQQESLPQKFVVVGCDYISLEAAFSYQHLGSDVTIVAGETNIEPSIEKELWRAAKKAGISVLKDVEILDVTQHAEGIDVSYVKGGETKVIAGTHLYQSASWLGNTEGLGLERLGIERSESGHIHVSDSFQTARKNIWAIGDVLVGEPLATKAIKQGKVLAERLAGQKAEWDDTFTPRVFRTLPPIASVGWTSKEAEQAGREINTSTVPFRSNGYAMITGKGDGLCTLIKDEQSDEILGVHMIGEGAVEMIATGTLVLEMAGRDEDVMFPMYPHPSYLEVFMESAEEWDGKAIHQPPKKEKRTKQPT